MFNSKMPLRIISISDVITNSSSEVFTIYTIEGVNKLKSLVESVIPEKFDDVFELSFIIDEYFKEQYKEDTIYKALDHDYYIVNEERPVIEGIKVTSKVPKYDKFAEKLSKIDSIFDHEEIFY